MCQLIIIQLASMTASCRGFCGLVGLVLLWMASRQQHSAQHDGIRINRYLLMRGAVNVDSGLSEHIEHEPLMILPFLEPCRISVQSPRILGLHDRVTPSPAPGRTHSPHLSILGIRGRISRPAKLPSVRMLSHAPNVMICL